MEISNHLYFGRDKKSFTLNDHLAAIEGGTGTAIFYTVDQVGNTHKHRVPRGTRTRDTQQGDVLVINGETIPVEAICRREKDAERIAANRKRGLLGERAH